VVKVACTITCCAGTRRRARSCSPARAVRRRTLAEAGPHPSVRAQRLRDVLSGHMPPPLVGRSRVALTAGRSVAGARAPVEARRRTRGINGRGRLRHEGKPRCI
jgi:hypothetical protein